MESQKSTRMEARPKPSSWTLQDKIYCKTKLEQTLTPQLKVDRVTTQHILPSLSILIIKDCLKNIVCLTSNILSNSRNSKFPGRINTINSRKLSLSSPEWPTSTWTWTWTLPSIWTFKESEWKIASRLDRLLKINHQQDFTTRSRCII